METYREPENTCPHLDEIIDYCDDIESSILAVLDGDHLSDSDRDLLSDASKNSQIYALARKKCAALPANSDRNEKSMKSWEKKCMTVSATSRKKFKNWMYSR